MTESLLLSIAIVGFIVILGKAFDLYLLLKEHKSRLHAWITEKWSWLNKQKVRNLPVISAQRIIKAEQWVFGKKLLSWRVLLISAAVSFSLTDFAINTGKRVVNNWEANSESEVFFKSAVTEVTILCHRIFSKTEL